MAQHRTSREGKTLIATTLYLEERVDSHYKEASGKKYGKPNKSRLMVEKLTKGVK